MREQVQRQVQQLAQSNPDAFRAILSQSYGDKLTPERREALLADAQEGRLPLPARFAWLPADQLQGAMGAYSPAQGGTVYINQDLANRPERLASVLLEESGHHLDQVIGGPDAASDEGERFRIGVQQGSPLSTEQLAEISASVAPETITLDVDGQPTEVEAIFPAVIAYLGKVGAGTAIDVTIDMAIAALTGEPFDTWRSVRDNVGWNAAPGGEIANKARKANQLRRALDTARETIRAVNNTPAGRELLQTFNRAGAQLSRALDDMNPVAAREAYDTLMTTLDQAHRLRRGGRVTFERFGRFNGADYHGAMVNGRKNPAPRNGQLALDHSIELGGNSRRRMALQPEDPSRPFVVLDRTAEGVYHGHSRSWAELDQRMRQSLINAGIVNRQGRILRGID